MLDEPPHSSQPPVPPKELRYCRRFPQALPLGDPPGGSGGGGVVFIQMLGPPDCAI